MAANSPASYSFLNLDGLIVRPPISSNSVKNFHPDQVQQDAQSTRIIVHQRFAELIQAFLEHKRQYGSKYEKQLYGTSETFTWKNEVSRLIEKRPLVFMGAMDHTMLRSGEVPRAPTTDEWDRVGTAKQHLNQYLTLTEYLSYDEIMLASLIGVSGQSFFINDGNRFNSGQPGLLGLFEPRGVIIGLVGARFEREDRMDSTHVRPSVNEPYQDQRLSKIIQDFFGVNKELSTSFDVQMYEARMRITVDLLLLEANLRAKESGKKAYAYVVGLGLGVWQHLPEQATYYIDTFRHAIQQLSLPNISTLEFAWIKVPQSTQDAVTKAAAEKGIRAIFSRRDPAEKLNSDELLVLSYAWDDNAFPGNEYWQGSLCGSGDPAAACMSTIGELHNPFINPYTHRVQVLE